MKLEDIIIIVVVLAIAIGIIVYLSKAKKRGEKCVGCPYSKQCSSKKNNCTCSSKTEGKK